MTDWPADKVERWAVERLIPYARNARTHDEASWGTRLHLPMQFLAGSVARASRVANPVLSGL